MPSSGKYYKEKKYDGFHGKNELYSNFTHGVGAIFIDKTSDSEVSDIGRDNHGWNYMMTYCQYSCIMFTWSISVPKPYA